VPGESITGHLVGPLGGGQVGYNLQLGGLVIGVEGEGSAADVKGDTTQTIWDHWSIKAEYDFYDFGTRAVTLVGTFAGAPIEVPGVEVRQRLQVGKIGLNYRF
jgi:opacity protein-like surface antigen